MNLVNCTASNNGFGFVSQSSATTTLRLARCSAFDNSDTGIGIYLPAIAESSGDNISRGSGVTNLAGAFDPMPLY